MSQDNRKRLADMLVPMPPAPQGARQPLPKEIPNQPRRAKMVDTVLQGLMGLLGLDDPLAPEASPATGVGALLGMAGPVVMGGLKRVANPIRAYHGSPYDFDKFKLSQIGTGEGAQAYGHGLYFAESPGVAKSYQQALAQRHLDTPEYWDSVGTQVPGFLTQQEQDDLFSLQQKLQRNASGPGNPPLTASESARFRSLKDKYDNYYAGVEALKPKGRMYEVNLHVKPEELLDWDAPAPANLQANKQIVFPPEGLDMGGGGRIIDNRQRQAAPDKPYPYILRSGDANFGISQADVDRMLGDTGSGAYTRLTATQGSQPAASVALKAQGIPGLRYLDGISRTRGEGTRNYVIWDEDVIEILRKYGILPPIGAAAASQALPKKESK